MDIETPKKDPFSIILPKQTKGEVKKFFDGIPEQDDLKNYMSSEDENFWKGWFFKWFGVIDDNTGVFLHNTQNYSIL